jgi:hypothetical protein
MSIVRIVSDCGGGGDPLAVELLMFLLAALACVTTDG